MAETSLLEDALARLSDLFLAVIVGEFNAGKSSVVNALLGGPFLKEGVLPTTNEISVLRHVDEMRGPEGGEGGGGARWRDTRTGPLCATCPRSS